MANLVLAECESKLRERNVAREAQGIGDGNARLATALSFTRVVDVSGGAWQLELRRVWEGVARLVAVGQRRRGNDYLEDRTRRVQGSGYRAVDERVARVGKQLVVVRLCLGVAVNSE